MSTTPDSTLDDPQQIIYSRSATAACRAQTAERDEALEQQTATAEVLQVINSSPGDLAPVFDAMLEKAMRLCDAASARCMTYDGEHFRAAAMRGVPPACADFVRVTRSARAADSSLDRACAVKRLSHRRHGGGEAYRRVRSVPRALSSSAAHAPAGVALRKDDVLLGSFTFYRQEVRPFSDKQIALLQNFAAQAVIAMENARLITETREALEQQTATAEVLQVINSSPGDLRRFSMRCWRRRRLCEAESGSLATYRRRALSRCGGAWACAGLSRSGCASGFRHRPGAAWRIERGEHIVASRST